MKYFIAIQLVILQVSVLSQEPILTLDPEIKKANQFYESISFIHKASQLTEFILALAEENKVNFYLLDNTWRVINQFSGKREWVTYQSVYEDYNRYITKSNISFSKDFKSIGTINTGNKLFITAFQRNHNIYFQQLDFATGTSKNLILWKAPDTEKILHAFNFKNKFYWITYSKKKDDIINLYISNEAGKTQVKNYSIRNLITPAFHYSAGSSAIGSDFIDSDKKVDLLKASARIKFYAQNNSFYIVSDDIMGKTYITDVNLDNFEETNYFIEHKPACITGSISNQNSFLLKDHLLQVNVCNGTFTFRIINLSNKQEVTYSIDKNSEIHFKNSDMMQYGKTLFNPDEKKLNKTSQFIRKVDSEGLSVLAEVVDSAFEITMGSSEMIQTGGGGSSHIPGGSVTGPDGQRISLPGTWVSRDFYDQSTRTIFFKSLFDKNDLRHLDKALSPDDKLKLIDEFYTKRKVGAINHIINEGKVITGYYDKDLKKFIVIRF